MSLSNRQFYALIQEVKKALTGRQITLCRQGGPRTFILEFAQRESDKVKPEAENQLLICLQEPFLRYHLTRSKHSESPEKLCHQINARLSGASLVGVDGIGGDRILKLDFGSNTLIAELFTKKPNLHLIDSNNQILASLNPIESPLYEAPPFSRSRQEELLSGSAPDVSSAEIERLYIEKERLAAFHQAKQAVKSQLQATLKRCFKKIESCREQLRHCLEWPKEQHFALLLQSNLFRVKRGMKSLTVSDWEQDGKEVEIPLDSQLDPREEVELRFKKSRKLKSGIPHLERQIAKAEAEGEQLKRQLEILEAIQDQKALKAQFPEKKQPSPQKVHSREKARKAPYREYTSQSGIKIWVGRTAADNDALTFRYARGSDWWLHVADSPGSHVIIRTPKGAEPDFETLEDAKQLALIYSKAKREGKGEICLTQRKFVSRLGSGKIGKGNLGKVQVSRHKVIPVVIDPARIERLKK